MMPGIQTSTNAMSNTSEIAESGAPAAAERLGIPQHIARAAGIAR